MSRMCLLAVLCLMLTALPIRAQAVTSPPVALGQDRSVPKLGAAMEALLDEGAGLAAMVKAFEQGRFERDFNAVARQGMPYQPVWLAARLVNVAPDDGRGADAWIPEIRTYGIVAADVYLIRADGLTETLLRHSIHAPFDPLAYSGPRLRAIPVTLAPDEQALLMVRLVFGPVARANIALLTPLDHSASVFTVSIAIAAWYAFMVACLLFHFGFSLSMRSRVGVAYGAVLTLGLVFIAYLDGFLFRFVYPDLPQRHLGIGIGLLLLTASLGFGAARLSLRDLAERSKGARACLAGAVLSLVAAALVPVIVPEIMANIAYAAFVAMVLAQALAAAQWQRVFGMPRRVLQALSVALALAVATLLGTILAGHALEWMPLAWQIKALFAATAIWTIAALSLGLVSMRRDHEASLQRELAAVSERERVAQDLLASERNYSHARDLADQRRVRLASASHDFRQPLASLRLTMIELGDRLDAEQRERLADAFDYMEDISSDLLDEAHVEADDTPEVAQSYPLSLILDTMATMFGPEAEAKGLTLRITPSSRQTDVPPLILTRIVGNLVSNAVKYTTEGRVAVGVRLGEPGRLRIVVGDTGPGLSDTDLTRFREAYVKGEGSVGSGLGLAICHDLAAQNGLTLTARSRLGRGTCFLVEVPGV